MSAELVRRLRLGFFSDVATEIASKAADEIERLTAERDALSAQLRAAGEQEPVAHIDDLGHIQFTDGGKLKCGDRLYTRPTPPASALDARDAERWRWLRENGKEMTYDALLGIIEEYGDRADAKLDAAILAAKEKK